MLTTKTRQFIDQWNAISNQVGMALMNPADAGAMAAVRTAYNAVLAQNLPPEGVTVEAVTLGGVPGLLIVPEHITSDAVAVYIHGGAYLVGDPSSYLGIGGNYAKALGTRVYLPAYRLAPEHPFPAAIDDTLQFYAGLLESGIAANKIVLIGESAGGALTVTAMVAARDQGLPLPAAGVAISPWANLQHTGASMVTRDGIDPTVSKAGLDIMAGFFLGGAAADAPLASPVFADVAGLPPIMIQIGESEVMLSDALRLATHLAESGVRVTLESWPGMFHAWHFVAAHQPESQAALQSSVAFIASALELAGAGSQQ
jgi:epsilon-lactone hydrolase